jgi:hypothetical protein
MADTKEVIMDVAEQNGGTRRRRRRVQRRTAKQQGGDNEATGEQASTHVVKESAMPVTTAPATATPLPNVPTTPPILIGGARKSAPVVFLAPAKKKISKVVLVPKTKHKAGAKTFKMKRVRVTIDNTAKTVKRRRLMTAKIDAMTDDQIREAAVAAKLSRRESVAKAPVSLLKQMMKDYQTLKGQMF